MKVTIELIGWPGITAYWIGSCMRDPPLSVFRFACSLPFFVCTMKIYWIEPPGSLIVASSFFFIFFKLKTVIHNCYGSRLPMKTLGPGWYVF